jgi:hypothetical protein
MEKGQGLSMREEFAALDFNSSRLEKRFIRTMETLAGQPDKSIWFCSKNRAEAKGIYRMLGNDRLDRDEIMRAHREAAIRRMVESEKTVLAVQDTTSLNYTTQTKMEGIGYISGNTLGVNIHSCLAVTEDGLVLGVLAQSSYNRTQPHNNERTHDSKKVRALEDKESFRWIQTLGGSTVNVPLGVHIVTVCDREGDMYELFDEAERAGQAFLIRIAQNRKTVENKKIMDEIRAKPCLGRVKTKIPRDSRAGVKEREATLQIRYADFEVKRPNILNKNKGLKETQKVNVIYVREEQQGKAGEAAEFDPVEWFLITNEPVENTETAYEKAVWYMQRWKIERFHYVLKSGCAVEKLQERSMEKTTTLVLMYSIIAAAVMNITYIARVHPQLLCTVCFEEDEWKVLYCTANKTKKPPEKPYTIAEAVTYLSWLGGPKRAPSDGPPGVKTIWIGLNKLNTLLTYREWLPNSVGQV